MNSHGAEASSPPGSEFSRTARAVYLGMAGPLLLTFPTTVVVARGLGPADKGVWSIVLQAFFLLEMISSMGAATYYIVRLGRDLDLEEAMPTAVFQGLMTSTLVAGAAIAIGAQRLLRHHQSALLTCVIAVSLVLLVVGRHLAHLGLAANLPRIYPYATLAQAGAQLFAVVAFQFATPQLTLLEVALSFGIGATIRVLVPLVLLLRVSRPKWRIDLRLWRDSMRFGWRRALFDIEDALNTRIPLLLLSVYRPLTAVGVYSVALGLAEVMGQTGAALSLAALRGFAQDAGARVAEFARLTVALSISLALLAVPASLLIPLVFGSPYRAATGEFLLLLLTVPVLAVNRMMTSALSASHRVGVVAKSGAASLAGITALGLLFIPRFGANGASVALLAGMAAQTAIASRTLAKESGKKVESLLVPRISDFRSIITHVRRLASLAAG